MNTSSKIVLVYAGGTIGMQPKNGELAPPKDESDFETACQGVVKEFSEHYKVDIDFKYFDKVDSTERTPSDWINLFRLIRDLQNKYLAIVIAHGTDTLANTASALSFAFSHPNSPNKSSQLVPVNLTASQEPIYKSGGDGKFNLYHGLETALQMSVRNVNRISISFWDKVILGTRAIKTHDRRYNAFDSPALQPIGQITSGGVEISHFIESLGTNNQSSAKFSDGISTAEISPATPEGIIKSISESAQTKVLILKTLGEGNVPKRLIPEIKEQTSKGKIIVLSSPFAGGSVGASVYELGAEAIRAGAIPAGDMVPPAIDAKCSWLIGNGVNNRQEFFKKLQANYVGELTERIRD